MEEEKSIVIKAIIGLGNPGPKYYHHRHSIGFRVLDVLAQEHGVSWQEKGDAEVTQIQIDMAPVLLVKPQTFMNSSGKVIPALLKKGIKPENILVVHDELEKPFGSLQIRLGGSHRGHNGLRSIIGVCGRDFYRLRFGVGRPEDKAHVSDYVLTNFGEPAGEIERLIGDAATMIYDLIG